MVARGHVQRDHVARDALVREVAHKVATKDVAVLPAVNKSRPEFQHNTTVLHLLPRAARKIDFFSMP